MPDAYRSFARVKALRFEQGELHLAEIAKPNREGEALVRVTLAGICNTDLEIVRGYAGFNGTLGHEFVGVVETSPDASQIGRRVVGEINIGCGNCNCCQAGDARHCTTRTALGIHHRDGAFAEFLTLPPQNLFVVPDNVSDHQAVFTEPLAAACEILDQVTINSSHKVAVIGDGKLGQLIARVLATTGCELILIGKHADKLELAAKAGIKTFKYGVSGYGTGGDWIRSGKISGALPLPVQHPKEITGALPLPGPYRSFDFVVEASGSAGGLQTALDLVKARGTIILKSTFHGGAVPVDTTRIVVDEISLVGSRCGRFEAALKLLESGQINVEPLIAAEFPLTEAVNAMASAAKPGTLKTLLTTVY
ncbi:MAG: alcohol dehydrogenase catalytic domain-containing protein [Acidobacteriota bacterium]|nr:alcohol dehydrogenase catalytic domain-containing protein [Acidobacteriota bacterium]